LRALLFDAEKLPPVRLTEDVLHFDGFTGQSSGDEDRPNGAFSHAIAAMADPVDHEMLNHDWPQ
jgi:hypothetical protein